jgi:hypothetical protein
LIVHLVEDIDLTILKLSKHGRRQEKPLVFTHQHTGDMRADQADESNGANKGDRDSCKEANRHHRLQPQSTYINSKARRLVFTQP